MHKLNVLILGPASFISTLDELKPFLKFNALSKNINEKVIPDDVTSKIINYLEENQELIKFKILDKGLIQESLGIKNIDDIFGLSLPFVFLIQKLK